MGVPLSSKRKTKKKSIVVLIASSFWLFYVVLTTWQYYQSAGDSADMLIEGRKAAMKYVITTAVNTLVDENVPLFESQMKQSRELFLTDFYILQKDDKVLSYHTNTGSADSINHKYRIYDQLIETDILAYKTVRIFDYALTVGITTNKPQVVLNVVRNDIFLILKDIAMVTTFLSFLLFLYLKDIINLSKVLSSKDRSKLENLKSLSQEGHTLLKASQGFQNEQTNLKGVNEHYSNTITPAILHEINSGNVAPYSFNSTMIRIDLNGYTQIFLEKREEYITQIMNTYFTKARDVIERYDGLVYQYIGDEIVFHIKESKQNSQALAISCVRSLIEVADLVEKSLPEDAEHHFKIKCCFADGKMRFVNLDTGYGLSGLSLIETARLLTQIEDKSKSSVCFYLDTHKNFDFLCKVDNHKPALFKGFQNQMDVACTSTFNDVSHFIENKDFASLSYFRSNSDLTIICDYFSKNISIESEDDFFTVSSFLKKLNLRVIDTDLVTSFSNLLSSAITRNRENWLSDKALATVIALTSHLIPASNSTPELLSLLNECLNHADHRTCANAILVLGEFSNDSLFLREFMHSSNNRVSADAMLITGKDVFDKELAHKLESYIKSKNPVFQASGIFVARELITHFETNDPVFFESNEDLQRLKDLVPEDKKKAA